MVQDNSKYMPTKTKTEIVTPPQDKRVCVFVLSPELHVQSSPNIYYKLPMAVTWSSFGGIAISCVV